MVNAGGVYKAHIVLGKCHGWQRQQFNAVVLGVQTHGRVHGAGEAVKKATLYAAVFKQLTHILQGVYGVLYGLCWKAVHQVGVYQNTRL